jgi:hypothetical protein
MRRSGFTFVHNAVRVGIPIKESVLAVRPYVDEMVVVDAGSDDETTVWLEAAVTMGVIDKLIVSEWGKDAGETLSQLHEMHTECKHDTIVHFEADEVFDKRLILPIYNSDLKSAHVWRIQLEQNFQRARWYPEKVHRVFQKGTVKKVGHTTGAKEENVVNGHYLWDCTNIFRDNWLARVDQQAKLWKGEARYLMVPQHCTMPVEYNRQQAIERLKLPHWKFKHTPFDIPEILKPLVGRTRY